MGFISEAFLALADLLAMTLVTPVWLAFSTLRLVLEVTLVKLRWKNSVEFLRGLDAAFVFKHLDRPGNRLNFCSFAIVEGRPDLAKMRARVEAKLISVKSKKNASRSCAKRLTQYVRRSMGYFFWAEESGFQLENHVRFATTEDTCKRCNEEFPEVRCYKDERDLANFIADISHDDFPEEFSPWEILVLLQCQDDPDVAPAYAVVFRFHHVLADGVSHVRSFVNSLIDENMRAASRRPSRSKTTAPPKKTDSSVIAAGEKEEKEEEIDSTPQFSLPRGFVGVLEFIRGFCFIPNMARNAFTGPDNNGFFGRELQGDRVMCWSEPLPLSLFRDVEKVQNLDVTINDVYVAGITGALLKRTKYSSTPSSPSKRVVESNGIGNGEIRLPVPPTTDLKISAVIPVGLYDCRCPSFESAPENKPPPKTCDRCDPQWENCFGNRVGVVRIQLDCNSDTPASRLRSTREICVKMKKSVDIAASYCLGTCFFNVIPNPLCEPLIRNHTTTLVASNLAGPDKRLHIFGNRILRLVYWVPQTGDSGMGVSIMSYNGQATLALAADKSLLTDYDDAKDFVKDIVTEIKLLAGATNITENKSGDMKGKYSMREFATLLPITPPAIDSPER